MGEDTRKWGARVEAAARSLGELIHAAVRRAIETAVDEEVAAALGAATYVCTGTRRGDRNGTKPRPLSRPTGPLDLTLPRARLFVPPGTREWTSTLLPRRSGLDAWRPRAQADVDAVDLYLDALLALRVRSAGKVVSVPVLGVVAVLADGQKPLVALELCAGGESFEAWKSCLEDLVSRGLPAPVLCIIDGHVGLRRAVERTWPGADVQRCGVHKLRNLERKAPKHALAEVREDFHRIVYAMSGEAARAASSAFERTWATRCPGVVRSLHEGGDERLTFFRFPPAQWKTLSTTNVIERLNEEFRRRVKTQGSLPTEDAAVILRFSLVASGQIRLRKLDGWPTMVDVMRARPRSAA